MYSVKAFLKCVRSAACRYDGCWTFVHTCLASAVNLQMFIAKRGIRYCNNVYWWFACSFDGLFVTMTTVTFISHYYTIQNIPFRGHVNFYNVTMIFLLSPSVYSQDLCRFSEQLLMPLLSCFFLPLSPSRVYLMAQERQDEVSNWLCVQVMLSNFKHYGITQAKKRQRSAPQEEEEEKKTSVISEK